MTAAGFDSQVGYAVESPSGTYTAPTRTIEHVKSTVKLEVDRITSKGIKAGRRHQGRWASGSQRVKGTISHELASANIGLLLKQAMGAVVDSGAGPYIHVYTPGPLVETQTLTVQVGKPDEGGIIRVHSYTGMQIPSLQISSKVGEIAQLDVDFYGQNLDVAQTLAGASYSSTWAPFTFVHGSATIAGSAYEFGDVTIKCDNKLQMDRYTHRATNPARPKLSKEAGFREWGGTFNSDFFDMSALNRFIAGTEVAVSLVYSAGASSSLTIAGNARFDGSDTDIDGAQMTKQALPFTFLSTTGDSNALTITLVNSDATS